MSAPIVLAVLLLLVGSIACSKITKSAPSEETRLADGRTTPSAVQAGDRVVIESAMATFVEGVIVSASRDRARVQLGAGGEVSERVLADLYVPSARDARDGALREGSYAVCRMPDGWRGCRIEAVGSLVRVIDDEAAPFDLPWSDVLAPTPVTELNVRQRFERNAKRRAFRDGAKSAGRPRVPANWQPAMNDRVLVEQGGSWVGAQVKGLRKGAVRVQWDADHRQSDAPTSEVAPEPPIDFAPTVGTYVLARPAAGARTWPVMRVESAGVANLELSDELGDRHHLPIRDVMPLERGR